MTLTILTLNDMEEYKEMLRRHAEMSEQFQAVVSSMHFQHLEMQQALETFREYTIATKDEISALKKIVAVTMKGKGKLKDEEITAITKEILSRLGEKK